MSETVITGDFGELVIETEQIEVTTNLPRQDQNWRFTDAAGHEHRWVAGSEPDMPYPTLKRVVDSTYWCDGCREEHDEAHLECRLCGEAIEPGMVGPEPFRKFIPGRRSAYLNGQPISGERAEELLAQARAKGQ